jgi:hypothetical protein
LNVLLEHRLFDTPLSAPSHLDCFELPAADEGVRLGGIYLELFGDIGQCQESGHGSILPLTLSFGVVIHSFGPFAATGFGVDIARR